MSLIISWPGAAPAGILSWVFHEQQFGQAHIQFTTGATLSLQTTKDMGTFGRRSFFLWGQTLHPTPQRWAAPLHQCLLVPGSTPVSQTDSITPTPDPGPWTPTWEPHRGQQQQTLTWTPQLSALCQVVTSPGR